MSSIGTHPHLRLVGVSDAHQDGPEWARHDVAAENKAAASNTKLDPTDPRWVLAVRAYSQLQGTALTPDRRERLVQNAKTMGVRPFDANLIIAIVQDHARRGNDLGDAAGTVALLEPPARRRSDESVTLRWAAAILSALVANLFLMWWLLG